MCLAVVAINARPDLPLLMMGNRDEFYGRPTENAHWWDDAPRLFAGRDTRAGGTWFGLSRDGRYGLVTNYRETIADGDFLSRGQLLSDFLNSDSSAGQFAKSRQRESDEYRGFSLIAGSLNTETVYCSNRAAPYSRRLEPGVYGLSNELLDTPWPKILRVKKAVERWLKSASPDVEPLFTAFLDRETDAEPAAKTRHLPAPMRHALTAPFVVGDTYGTRATTLAIIESAGTAEVIERRFNAGGVPAGETRERFSVLAT